jgi:hypothetical protein
LHDPVLIPFELTISLANGICQGVSGHGSNSQNGEDKEISKGIELEHVTEWWGWEEWLGQDREKL